MNLIPPETSFDNVIVFDGACNFCASSVQFILRHDREGVFKYASAQSEIGRKLYLDSGLDPDSAHTMLLVTPGGSFRKSDAAIEIARRFGGMWTLMNALRFIPRPLRDWVYNRIAANRYRLFGRRETCFVPSDKTRERFLS